MGVHNLNYFKWAIGCWLYLWFTVVLRTIILVMSIPSIGIPAACECYKLDMMEILSVRHNINKEFYIRKYS